MLNSNAWEAVGLPSDQLPTGNNRGAIFNCVQLFANTEGH